MSYTASGCGDPTALAPCAPSALPSSRHLSVVGNTSSLVSRVVPMNWARPPLLGEYAGAVDTT
eukprot:5499452-Prymnesium_polylepis.2